MRRLRDALRAEQIEQIVKANFGCQFDVQIKIHTTDAYTALSHQIVRDAIGGALDMIGISEEVDYTIEVKRVY